CQHVARDPEVLDGPGEREGVRRNDADRPLEAHEVLLIEGFRIDDGRIDVGEDPELVRAPHVVAVARRAVGDDPLAIAHAHLAGLEGLDHAVRLCHPANPVVGLDAHGRDSSAESGPPEAIRTHRGDRPPGLPGPRPYPMGGGQPIANWYSSASFWKNRPRPVTTTSRRRTHGTEDRQPDSQRQADDAGDRPAHLAAAGP